MLHKHKTAVILIILGMLVVAGLGSYLKSVESRKVVPIMGARFLSDTGAEEATGLAWSPDNKILAVARQKYSNGGDPPVPEESYIDFLDVEKLSSHTLEKTRFIGGIWLSSSFVTITGVCWSPKQNQIAFARANSIWLVNLDNEQAPIRLGDGEACAWSKDGKTLAVIEAIRAADQTLQASKIYTLNVSTGEKQEVYSRSTILNNSIAWAPGSNRLAFVQRDYRSNSVLILWDLDSGKPWMPIYTLSIAYPTWSPDGTMLALGIHSWVSLESSYNPKLTIIKADNGSILWESSVLETLDSISWSPDGKTIAYVSNRIVYALDVDELLKNK
jgi:Tol biopolymer transport system component